MTSPVPDVEPCGPTARVVGPWQPRPAATPPAVPRLRLPPPVAASPQPPADVPTPPGTRCASPEPVAPQARGGHRAGATAGPGDSPHTTRFVEEDVTTPRDDVPTMPGTRSASPEPVAPQARGGHRAGATAGPGDAPHTTRSPSSIEFVEEDVTTPRDDANAVPEPTLHDAAGNAVPEPTLHDAAAAGATGSDGGRAHTRCVPPPAPPLPAGWQPMTGTAPFGDDRVPWREALWSALVVLGRVATERGMS